MPSEEKPTCPAFLGKEARAEWARQVKELEAVGLLSKKSRAILASYCEAWGQFCRACQVIENGEQIGVDKKGNPIIANKGEVVPGSTGSPVMNPWVRIKEAAAARMARLAERFGFSPAGEQKVKPKKTEDGTPKLFSRQRA